jgi:murein L,D-transpeptidase YafK
MLEKNQMKKFLFLLLCTGIFLQNGWSQSFLETQMAYPTVSEAYKSKEALLKKEFAEKGLTYPAKYIYIRSFKYDSQLEVWVKNNLSDTFTLFKTYHICALSGQMGPKRMAGDYQVPEGFYYINDFNPQSNYHLSLGLNYPNFSDRLTSGVNNLGGDIYIHGSCVSMGCIPLTDGQMDEVYILAVNARNLGEDFIPVHIYPIRFDNPRSVEYLTTISRHDVDAQKFWVNLRNAYEYFQKTHRLPVVMTDKKGDYVLSSR